MTTRLSRFATGELATITSESAGDLIVNQFFYDLPAAQNIAGDIIDIGILPAYHTVDSVALICDDLDSNGTPTITLDVGLMSGTPGDKTSVRTCGAEFYAASTVAQTGSTIAAMTLTSGRTVLPTELDRSIGVKIVAGSATPAAGRIRLAVNMHAANHKLQF